MSGLVSIAGGIRLYRGVRLYRMRNHTSPRTTRKEAGCRYHIVFRRDVHLMAM